MNIQRVALIFDNRARPETTGVYCRRALGRLVEVEHFLPTELSQIPADRFDLFLNIDDGLHYELPDRLRPAAWWAIDTHMDFQWSLKKSQGFDLVFAAQRDGAQKLKQAGIESATWLPLACDPFIHQKHEVAKRHDVCFVGNVFPGPRAELLRQIRRRFADSFVGQRYFEEMAETYSASRLVFNRSVRNDVNMRVFEALACGSLLVTNDLAENGQAELFQDGMHFATYAEAEELLDKVAYYLKHDDIREQIAARGRKETLARHTYRQRMETVLQCASQLVSSTQVGVVHNTERDHAGPPAKVSACVVSWKRPENVRQIVAHLHTQPLIDDIVVWNNNPEVSLEFDDANVTVVQSERNLVTYGRYLAARHARHDVVYTQDDDSLVHNIDELWQCFQSDPERITHALKPTHLITNAENVYGTAQMALVGWGAFFRKEWVDVFDTYRDGYGEDELLIRKADRLFSLLLNRRHHSLPARVTDLPGTEGEEALSVMPDHLEKSAEAVQRALSLLGIDAESVHEYHPHWGGPSPLGKEGAYFEFDRPEVVALIPESARRVLDIGCGAGRLGEAVKRRQPAEVVGIELDETAAQRAAERLDDVVVGNVEWGDVDFAAGSFDCVVCADILEHLRHPEQLLAKIRGWLQPGGTLVASIPNVRNHTVVRSLMAGNWTYESAGLLDDDHVRFFTRRELEKLLFRAGFEIQSLQGVPGSGYEEWRSRGKPKEVQAGRLRFSGVSPAEAEEFYIYQYLVRARPTPDRRDGLTSIILVTYNQVDYTRLCLDSVRRHTDEPYELIVVDNGSSDGTAAYLESLDGVRLIRNADNRGFPAAVNQGIEVARGEQLLLLNNDTVVTTGWLRRMLDALQRDESVGLVGPCSNNVSGPQQIAVTYEDLAELDGFAWDWGRAHRGRFADERRLVGFCLLIKRDVVERIGALDERFGIGCFEDDDYCLRAIQAGFRAVIARDAFVHHFGGRTFVASGVDFARLMQENRQRFEQKWAEQEPKLPAIRASEQDRHPQPRYSLAAPKADGLRLRDDDLRLSLCMIVRDNETTIRPCLESIRPWVDEMVVVDTGSKDRTPDICRELGARVYDFPWCDDFAAARNESLKHATGEWLFWMDSDDTIPEECGRKLRALVDGRHDASVLGYVMQVHCPGPPENGQHDVTVVDHVKLIRNRPDLRFEFRIHEQLIPSIRRAGGEVAWTDIHVVHSGSDHSEDGRQRKLERDFRLLRLEQQERGDHPFVLFNLGMTHADCEQHDEAIRCLKRCLKVSQPQESHVRKAYALLVSSLAQSERHDEAWDVCREGLTLFSDDKELLFRAGMLHQHLGRLKEAESAYLQALRQLEERHFSSVDVGIDGFKARHNLALVYDEMGEIDKALDQWQQAVEEQPTYRPGWRGLGETLLKAGRHQELCQLVDRLMNDKALQCEGLVMGARLLERLGDPRSARQYLETAVESFSDDMEPLRELCRLLFETGLPEEALENLQRLAKLAPDDGSVLHNLGAAYSCLQRFEEAVGAFRQSLRLRPNSKETRQQLEAAVVALGP